MAYFQAWNTPAYISFAEESTPGTEQSPVNWLGKVQSVTPTEKNNIQRHRHLGAISFVSWTPGTKDLACSLRLKPNEGKFFLMAYGAEAVTGTDPYTHTLSCARPLPTFTLEVAAIDAAAFFTRRLIGCKVKSMKLASDINGVLMADFEIIAATIAKYVAKTSSTPNLAKPYNFDQSTLTVNSVAIARAKSFVHTMDNGITGLNHLGTRNVNAYNEPGAIDDVTLELTGADDTLWDLMNADPPTEFDAGVSFVKDASNDEFNINWFNMPIEEDHIKPPEDERGGVWSERVTLPVQYSELEIIDSVATY